MNWTWNSEYFFTLISNQFSGNHRATFILTSTIKVPKLRPLYNTISPWKVAVDWRGTTNHNGLLVGLKDANMCTSINNTSHTRSNNNTKSWQKFGKFMGILFVSVRCVATAYYTYTELRFRQTRHIASNIKHRGWISNVIDLLRVFVINQGQNMTIFWLGLIKIGLHYQSVKLF